jgi:uncharacterized protein (TIGR03067 family)
MLQRMLVAGLFLTLLTTAWADDKEEAAKKELEKFKGEWKLVNGDIVMKFDGNKYEFEAGDNSEKGKFKIDAGKKHIDLEITEGNDKGKTQLGFYELKDGKLRLGLGTPGDKDRPAKLEDGENQFEFEKVKK